MTIVLDGNIVEVGGWWSGGGGIRELNDSLNVRMLFEVKETNGLI
jgi:hypothetical protein